MIHDCRFRFFGRLCSRRHGVFLFMLLRDLMRVRPLSGEEEEDVVEDVCDDETASSLLGTKELFR